jgi:uncharacterized membrane-anchored protein YjiN (DUF445 family)
MTTTNTNDRLEEIIQNTVAMLAKYEMCEEESNIIRTACQEYAREETKALQLEVSQLVFELSTCQRQDVPASELSASQSTARLLSAENTQLREENQQLQKDYEEEKEIVNRIWKAFGVSTYEQAGGKSIYELVEALRTDAEALASAVMLILPLAKGYVLNGHDVGSNQRYVDVSEQALETYRSNHTKEENELASRQS